MKICVYCSSSDELDSKYYKEGRAFGRELAKRGHSLVYGGYCKGIMAAVAEGVHENGGEITAVVPKVFDREGFTYEGCTRVIKTPDMNSRKKTMEAEAEAIAVLPGGIGTMDEFFEALVLKTIGEFDKPVGVLNTAGCYDILVQLLDRSTEDGFLSTSNRECARFFTDADVMLDHLEKESGLYDYPFIPLWDEASEILILGSFPSVKSRETGFFYGHPQNRFWKMLAGVFEDEVPLDIEQKKEFLHRHHIALWDVIASCEITGSSDSSIRNAVPTDLGIILDNAPIRRVYINGRTAEKYYKKYTAKTTELPAETLPSTSPANAAWSLPRLIEAWSIIRQISPSSEEARS